MPTCTGQEGMCKCAFIIEYTSSDIMRRCHQDMDASNGLHGNQQGFYTTGKHDIVAHHDEMHHQKWLRHPLFCTSFHIISQWRHAVIMSLHQNNIETSLWHNNDIIFLACIHWDSLKMTDFVSRKTHSSNRSHYLHYSYIATTRGQNLTLVRPVPRPTRTSATRGSASLGMRTSGTSSKKYLDLGVTPAYMRYNTVPSIGQNNPVLHYGNQSRGC